MADVGVLFRHLPNLDEIGLLVYVHEHLRPPLNIRLAEMLLSNLWDSLGHEQLCSYEIEFSEYEGTLLLLMESDLEFVIHKAKPVTFVSNETSVKQFFVQLLRMVQDERKKRSQATT